MGHCESKSSSGVSHSSESSTSQPIIYTGYHYISNSGYHYESRSCERITCSLGQVGDVFEFEFQDGYISHDTVTNSYHGCFHYMHKTHCEYRHCVQLGICEDCQVSLSVVCQGKCEVVHNPYIVCFFGDKPWMSCAYNLKRKSWRTSDCNTTVKRWVKKDDAVGICIFDLFNHGVFKVRDICTLIQWYTQAI